MLRAPPGRALHRIQPAHKSRGFDGPLDKCGESLTALPFAAGQPNIDGNVQLVGVPRQRVADSIPDAGDGLSEHDARLQVDLERFDQRKFEGCLPGAEPQAQIHGRPDTVSFRMANVAARGTAPKFKAPVHRIARLSLIAR